MRTTFVAAALAAASLAAPATAAPNGGSVVTFGAGALNVNDTGPSAGDTTSGVCSYAAGTVAVVGRTSAVQQPGVAVHAVCNVLINDVWYGAAALGIEPERTDVYAVDYNGTAPIAATPSYFCLTLHTEWRGQYQVTSHCVRPGASVWTGAGYDVTFET